MKNKIKEAEFRLKKEFEAIDQRIPESMPLLDKWLHEQKGAKPLTGVTALLIQHQFGNQFPQVKAMIKLGLEPHRIWWLDIPYTSNPEFRSKLETLGIPKKNILIHSYKLFEPYATCQMRRVQAVIKLLMRDDPDHLLVLDDGAYFLEALSTLKSSFRRVSIVEQTSRGIIKINENAAIKYMAGKYPVINVARSSPKLLLESPFIGHSVCISLKVRLAKYLAGKNLNPVLLIGFGAIGRSIAMSIMEYMNISPSEIYVFDKKSSRLREASRLGFSTWKKNNLSKTFGLVVGCTGRASFKCGDYIYLKDGAVLASASSGTVELSRQEFIELADASELDDMEVIREGIDECNIHTDIKLMLVDRNVVFLNGGFPLNFTGTHVNCIPIQYMQPTAILMVAAAVQAVTTKRRGLISPGRKFCTDLHKSFLDYLGPQAVLLPVIPRHQYNTPQPEDNRRFS